MNKKITGKISCFCISFLLLTFAFCGCGKTDMELDIYKANMSQFFENMSFYDASINQIDPESETATGDLLTILDSMKQTFEQMASLDVPDGFPGVEQLADEAYENISQAVSYYHEAYDGEEYDSTAADIAKQYYDRANVRLQYIVSIIHGNVPEDIYVYDDDSEEE